MTTHPQTTVRRSRGFTLVELMVVIVILGGLIAIVGPQVFRALARSDVGRAEAQMNGFVQSVNMYYLEYRKLPSNLDVLTEVDPKLGEPFIERIPLDPWGSAYDYKILSSKKFQIVSYGEDLQEGTEDDVIWPKEDDE